MMDKNHKEHVKKVGETLNKMTIKYCDEYLDDDYKKLCAKLIDKMSRKRNVPFLSGRIEIWAAAIVYAIGSINFLFDKSFELYVSGEDICNYFGTSNSTTAQKAKVIREMFKLQYYHSEFSTKRMLGKFMQNEIMIKSATDAKHFTWGGACDGWHLLKEFELSIVKERVPSGAGEVKHVHAQAHQFFYILSGSAALELEDQSVFLHGRPGCPYPSRCRSPLR